MLLKRVPTLLQHRLGVRHRWETLDTVLGRATLCTNQIPPGAKQNQPSSSPFSEGKRKLARFLQWPNPTASHYKTILRELSNLRELDLASLDQILRLMKEQNIPHDKYSRISVLRVIQAYSRLGNVTRAKELAHELRSSGLTSDIPSDLKCDLTALCSAVPLDWNAIGRVLEGTAEVENVKSILGAALLQTTDESALRSAVQALDWRLHKVINRAAFLAVTTNKIAQAQKVLQMTQLITKSLDSDCFSAILWYYIKGDQIGKAEELLRTMESIGVIPDVVAFTGVISARCKQMPPNESAVVALFNRMLELSPVNPGTQPNIITFNQMVTLFVILKKPRQALDVVAKMRQLGVKPNAATYSSLLGHDNARQAWQEMKSDGVVLDAVLTDSLLRIFLTMNNIGLAYDVWSVSKEHNVQLSRRRLDHLARYLRSAKLYEKAIEVTSAANLAKD